MLNNMLKYDKAMMLSLKDGDRNISMCFSLRSFLLIKILFNYFFFLAVRVFLAAQSFLWLWWAGATLVVVYGLLIVAASLLQSMGPAAGAQ